MGTSGLTVSVVGLGCNGFGLTLDKTESAELVHAAMDSGITLFDIAPNYGSVPGEAEEMLGSAVAGSRDQVVISTKFAGFTLDSPGNARASRRAVLRSVEDSLGRLRTDFIDLLYLHQPDERTPMAETLEVLDDLVRAGKVRYIGSSNLRAWQIVEAEHLSRAGRGSRFIAAQNAYSLIDRHVELDIAGVCERYGIGLTPYFPMAHGLLAKGVPPGATPPPASRLARRPQVLSDQEAIEAARAIQDYAAQRSLPLPHVAIGGLLAKPAVASVIAGASTPEQVRGNAAASDWAPSEEDLAALDAIAPPHRYVPLGSRTGHRR